MNFLLYASEQQLYTKISFLTNWITMTQKMGIVVKVNKFFYLLYTTFSIKYLWIKQYGVREEK